MITKQLLLSAIFLFIKIQNEVSSHKINTTDLSYYNAINNQSLLQALNNTNGMSKNENITMNKSFSTVQVPVINLSLIFGSQTKDNSVNVANDRNLISEGDEGKNKRGNEPKNTELERSNLSSDLKGNKTFDRAENVISLQKRNLNNSISNLDNHIEKQTIANGNKEMFSQNPIQTQPNKNKSQELYPSKTIQIPNTKRQNPVFTDGLPTFGPDFFPPIFTDVITVTKTVTNTGLSSNTPIMQPNPNPSSTTMITSSTNALTSSTKTPSTTQSMTTSTNTSSSTKSEPKLPSVITSNTVTKPSGFLGMPSSTITYTLGLQYMSFSEPPISVPKTYVGGKKYQIEKSSRPGDLKKEMPGNIL